MTALAIAKQERSALISRPVGPNQPAVLSFPPYRLDLAEERLWKDDRELRLRRKPFAILRYLAQNPRRLITHAEITEAVWGKIAMSESLLRTHVYDLRRVIGEEIIETVVGRGYRFVANVIGVEDGSSGRRRGEIRKARATAVVRLTGSKETRRLELVRIPAPADQIPDATLLLASPRRARVLRQVADVLDALGTTAIVVLMVGEAEVREVASTAPAERYELTRRRSRLSRARDTSFHASSAAGMASNRA